MRPKTILPLILLAACASALADPGDPPARVARLNYISGAVSYRPGSVEEWVAATPNYPMTTGDHLWADDGAGAEMHIGSTSLRMAGQTALEFLNLDDLAAQLSVRQGALNIRIRHLDDDQTFEIDTPNGAISLLRTGDYRIDVLPGEDATYVTVRGGEAEVTGAGNPFTVHPREMARVAGDPASVDINAVRPPDTWDRWCLDRDRREDEAVAASARYVPREMVGYEDLSTYGAWRDMPGYGAVWAPRVAVGWAPYHYGHWAWVDPWGWTWIDDAPWGFAPFHYGRWAFVSGGWFWVPGTIVARPVYAPAWSRSSADRTSVSPSASAAVAPASPGSRSARMKSSFPPITSAKSTSARSTSPTSPTSPISPPSTSPTSATSTARFPAASPWYRTKPSPARGPSRNPPSR